MSERHAEGASVRPWNRHDDVETSRLADLLMHYHLATEREKGCPVSSRADLPAVYGAEIDDPRQAFAAATVLLALSSVGSVVGCAVLTVLPRLPAAGTTDAGDGRRLELKRLWVEPADRGRGIAGALIGSAIERADRGSATLRLSVWNWREGAIRLYSRLGFTVVPSWDDRHDLVCLERKPS